MGSWWVRAWRGKSDTPKRDLQIGEAGIECEWTVFCVSTLLPAKPKLQSLLSLQTELSPVSPCTALPILWTKKSMCALLRGVHDTLNGIMHACRVILQNHSATIYIYIYIYIYIQVVACKLYGIQTTRTQQADMTSQHNLHTCSTEGGPPAPSHATPATTPVPPFVNWAVAFTQCMDCRLTYVRFIVEIICSHTPTIPK